MYNDNMMHREYDYDFPFNGVLLFSCSFSFLIFFTNVDELPWVDHKSVSLGLSFASQHTLTQ